MEHEVLKSLVQQLSALGFDGVREREKWKLSLLGSTWPANFLTGDNLPIEIEAMTKEVPAASFLISQSVQFLSQ